MGIETWFQQNRLPVHCAVRTLKSWCSRYKQPLKNQCSLFHPWPWWISFVKAKERGLLSAPFITLMLLPTNLENPIWLCRWWSKTTIAWKKFVNSRVLISLRRWVELVLCGKQICRIENLTQIMRLFWLMFLMMKRSDLENYCGIRDMWRRSR